MRRLLAGQLLLGLAAALVPLRHPVRLARAQRAHARVEAPRLDLLDWLERKLAARRLLQRRPRRIVLLRHGQSEGNANKTAYSMVPDSQIALTERGFAQGTVAGLQIRQLVGNETVRLFYSPYLRAQQTMLAVLQAFDSQKVQISLEPRLREQDFGNFQDVEAMDAVLNERMKFGRFYYRFPNGEAGTDVFDRMASFITYLFRTMNDAGCYEMPNGARQADNYVLITHGLLMRIFCMCYLRWTVTEFEQVWNPSNCEIWVLEALPNSARYELAGRWRATPYGGAFTDIKFGESRNQPLYEHMKRPLSSRSVTPGTPDALDSDELAHLRDLPLHQPRRRSIRSKIAGDAVMTYWYGEARRNRGDRGGSDRGGGGGGGKPGGGSGGGDGAASGSPTGHEQQDGGDATPPSSDSVGASSGSGA